MCAAVRRFRGFHLAGAPNIGRVPQGRALTDGRDIQACRARASRKTLVHTWACMQLSVVAIAVRRDLGELSALTDAGSAVSAVLRQLFRVASPCIDRWLLVLLVCHGLAL